MTANYFRARQIQTEWEKHWGTGPPPADCAHITPWTVVCRCELDQSTPWLAGSRYLQEVCPWCNQWLSSRPVPKVTA